MECFLFCLALALIAATESVICQLVAAVLDYVRFRYVLLSPSRLTDISSDSVHSFFIGRIR